MLVNRGFSNVRLWPRGVDTKLFRPERRDASLRYAWLHPEKIGSMTPDSPMPEFQLPETASAVEKIVITYVGRISNEKNLALLIESFNGLEAAARAALPGLPCPGCKLVFVGDGPARLDIERRCAEYGIDATFMGYRSGDDLARCYASSDIFAFPSVSETFVGVQLDVCYNS